MTDMNNTFKEYGFDIAATGGGCLAWRKDVADGYYIITDEGGCNLPLETDVMIYVGFYDLDGTQQTPYDELEVSFYDFERHFML